MPAARPANRTAPRPAGCPTSGTPCRARPIAPVGRLRAAGVAGICSPPGGTRRAATRRRNYNSRSAPQGLRVEPPCRAEEEEEEEDGDGGRMESGEGRRGRGRGVRGAAGPGRAPRSGPGEIAEVNPAGLGARAAPQGSGRDLGAFWPGRGGRAPRRGVGSGKRGPRGRAGRFREPPYSRADGAQRGGCVTAAGGRCAALTRRRRWSLAPCYSFFLLEERRRVAFALALCLRSVLFLQVDI